MSGVQSAFEKVEDMHCLEVIKALNDQVILRRKREGYGRPARDISSREVGNLAPEDRHRSSTREGGDETTSEIKEPKESK